MWSPNFLLLCLTSPPPNVTQTNKPFWLNNLPYFKEKCMHPYISSIFTNPQIEKEIKETHENIVTIYNSVANEMLKDPSAPLPLLIYLCSPDAPLGKEESVHNTYTLIKTSLDNREKSAPDLKALKWSLPKLKVIESRYYNILALIESGYEDILLKPKPKYQDLISLSFQLSGTMLLALKFKWVREYATDDIEYIGLHAMTHPNKNAMRMFRLSHNDPFKFTAFCQGVGREINRDSIYVNTAIYCIGS